MKDTIQKMNLEFFSDILLFCFFVAGIFTPPMVALLAPPPDISATEKRKLADFPPAIKNFDDLKKYPIAFEAFYNDRFGFRDFLVRSNSLILIKLFKKSPISKVVIGKNGWLYYNFDKDRIMEDLRGENPLTPSELRTWKFMLEFKRDWLAERNIKYIFMVAPNKHSVFPENIPSRYISKNGTTRLDQLSEYVGKNSDINILDLREAMLSAKTKYRVYHLTDTHWNDKGAYIAYQKLMGSIQQWYPDEQFLPIESMEQYSERSEGGDLALMLGLADKLQETRPIIKPRSSCARKKELHLKSSKISNPFIMICKQAKLNAMIFRDSAFISLIPFVSEHFKRAIYAWNNYDHAILKEVLDLYPIDIVIEERGERKLAYPPSLDYELQKEIFNQLPDLLLLIDSSTGYRSIHPFIQASTRLDDQALSISTTGHDPYFQLPSFNLTKNFGVMIKIYITSPIKDTIQVYYSTKSQPFYSESMSKTKSMAEGYNEIYFQLHEPDISGQIRMDLGKTRGDYLLHGIEVRGI